MSALSEPVGRIACWGLALLMAVVAACGNGATPIAPTSPTQASTEEPSPPDLETGWRVIEDYSWTVQPGCCGMGDVGPVSPEASIGWAGWENDTASWPPDGVYAVDLLRTADAPGSLQITVQPWVWCRDRPDIGCAPDPQPDPVTGVDPRIVADPDVVARRVIVIGDVGVVLVPIHQFGGDTTVALEGEPGALARLLAQGLDPAYSRWVSEPLLEGASVEVIRERLLERSADGEFPFGVDYCEGEACGPLAYRGPFGTSLLADPSWVASSNGLYGWRPITLEVRDGRPILHLWAGQVAG